MPKTKKTKAWAVITSKGKICDRMDSYAVCYTKEDAESNIIHIDQSVIEVIITYQLPITNKRKKK